MSAKIKHYNRTTQEEFASWKLDELTYDIPTSNDQLMDWPVWYNGEHRSFGFGVRCLLN